MSEDNDDAASARHRTQFRSLFRSTIDHLQATVNELRETLPDSFISSLSFMTGIAWRLEHNCHLPARRHLLFRQLTRALETAHFRCPGPEEVDADTSTGLEQCLLAIDAAMWEYRRQASIGD